MEPMGSFWFSFMCQLYVSTVGASKRSMKFEENSQKALLQTPKEQNNAKVPYRALSSIAAWPLNFTENLEIWYFQNGDSIISPHMALLDYYFD